MEIAGVSEASCRTGRSDFAAVASRAPGPAMAVLLTAVVLFAGSPAVTLGQDLAADWQPEVRTLLDQRQFDRAAVRLEKVMAVDPLNVDARRLRAEWFARRGGVAAALTQIDELLAAHPADRRSHLLRAQWLNQLGRSSAAQEVYDRWIDEHPDDHDMRIRRALTLRFQGDLDLAARELEAVLAVEPDNAFARHSLLRVRSVLGRASEVWRLATEFDAATGHTDAELGLIKAQLLVRVGAVEQALDLASRPPADPDQARRQLAFRALQLIRLGRQHEALRLLSPHADLRSDDYDALVDVGNAHAAADHLHIARAYFQRAATVTPERPEARMGLARIASREGRLSDSLARYQAIVADNPEALEASLGVIRIARLMDDTTTAGRALMAAREWAPRSIELYRAELLLALDGGDLNWFDDARHEYEIAQPNDPVAVLWRHRRHALETGTVDFGAVAALLDPFAPDVTAAALALLAATPAGDSLPRFKEWANDDSLPARDEMFLALARQAALRLDRDWTRRFVALAKTAARGEETPVGSGRSRKSYAMHDDLFRFETPELLAEGWWAYVATPFAWAPELAPGIDPQAVNVWLAAEVQKRIRAFAIETASPLEEEWLLRRAVWFRVWPDQWHTADAAWSLHEYLASLVPGAFDTITAQQIANAWNRADQWVPPGAADYEWQITRARWRQSRHDFAGALELYRTLAAEYPETSEPAQRQAVLLRSMGRTSEALAVLRELSSRPLPNPATRVEAASVLAALGRYQDAEAQLDLAEAEGFAEPLIFLRRAEVAGARGLEEQARAAVENGLERHPNADSLLGWLAADLARRGELDLLAQLLVRHRSSPWVGPDLVAAAQPALTAEELDVITNGAGWWFSGRWLPWVRIEARSLSVLRESSREAARTGERTLALERLLPALQARIPDTDLWLAAGRLYDLNGRWDESRRAYELAHALGLGRPDARVAGLGRLAREVDAAGVAREFARQVAETPEDAGLRAGLVTALIRAGEVNAARKALTPLIEAGADSATVRDLAAQVKGAEGSVRDARSLYSSILRGDPTDTDRRDALRVLQTANQWGFAGGYEFSDLRGRDGSPDPADWLEAFAGVVWQQPLRQSWGIEYRWFERSNEDASQLRLDYSVGIDQDWILRAHVAPAAEGDIIPRLKLGGGASRRITDEWFGTLDFGWLTFSDLDVYQFAPGASWRWHPRSTIEAKIYVNQNVLETGTSDWAVTGVVNANWELTRRATTRLSFAAGDESVANPIRDLIGNDSILSVGLSLNVGLGDRWSVIPSWRYEQHDQFDLNAFGLSAVFSY